MKEYKENQPYAIQFVDSGKIAICNYNADKHVFIDEKGAELSCEFVENLTRLKEAAIKEMMTEEQFKNHVKGLKKLPKHFIEQNLEFLM